MDRPGGGGSATAGRGCAEAAAPSSMHVRSPLPDTPAAAFWSMDVELSLRLRAGASLTILDCHTRAGTAATPFRPSSSIREMYLQCSAGGGGVRGASGSEV